MAEDLRQALEAERQASIAKAKMGRFTPKQLVSDIERNREAVLALGGKVVRCTILFSDIRGFTRISESMDPQQVVAFLNEYMTAMVQTIDDEGGLVGKFIGDGIMAVFNPEDDHPQGPQDALRAVRCGVRMQEKLQELKRRWVSTRPEVAALQVRVGINSGEVVAGSIGAETRMDYTVIGDNVNVASRIGSNGVGGEVHISESTYELVEGLVPATPMEPIHVKNRERPVRIYRVEMPT